tara:strand:+ start:145 stop:510 length:366 start_codon:yes stop_codon:yes gene_type:complete
MAEEEKKQTWSIDELVALTEDVQQAEIEYNGKILPVQWCELTEAEEPKISVPDSDLPEEDKNMHFAEIASKRMIAMMEKANERNPEGKTIDEDSWSKLPTTLRWSISNTVLQAKAELNQDF